MKILSLLMICTGLVFGAYPKFKSQSFDMVNVRFCPITANTPEIINELKLKGKRVKERDFTPKDEAQSALYREYCQRGNVMLKSYWEEKQSYIDLGLSSSALVVRTFLNKHKQHDISLYALSVTFVGLGYICQKRHYSFKSKVNFSKIKQIENNLILTANNSARARAYFSGIDNQEWDIKEEVAGLVSAEAIENRYLKQSLFSEEEFKTHILNFNLDQSEASKRIAQNNLDKAKAEKETARLNRNEVRDETSQVSSDLIKNRIIAALKAHEGGWLWTILSSIKPIFLYGDAGTGKTNTAVAFGLIRSHCLDIPVFRIADRHLRGENQDLWQLLAATNKHDCDSSILEALEDTLKRRLLRISEKPKKGEQFLLDEFTQLLKVNKELIEQFVTSTYSDCRKAREYFIGITHNLTNSTFGEGTKEMRQGGFIVKRFTLDGFRPIERVLIQTGLKDELGNDLSDVEKTMPRWFRAETIYEYFRGSVIEF